MPSIIKRTNNLYPIPKLFRLLLIIAFVVQVIVIVYNHLSGFYQLSGIDHFLLRLLRGVFYSLVGASIIALSDLLFIDFLNLKFSWNKKPLPRILIELLFTVLFAGFVSMIITLTADLIKPYSEPLKIVLVYNALMYAAVNILLVIILEALIFFSESNQAKVKAENLERELSQIRFEVLKSQINPHFMFNSLNVLSGLIETDIKKAQLFIDEFSHIYRYVLETIEKPVVSLNQELDFARSYTFLQQIRYSDALTLKVTIPATALKLMLPPLSLQVVFENAIKHNIINSSKPLYINIDFCEGWLIIKNNIQPKISQGFSSGLGQNNMLKRYALIGNRLPEFLVETNQYVVKLPLINTENDETARI